ncbi:hypothetical protein [Halomonas nitroreducens]|uniref:Uncharacterized protein n=1 Tax=Halomonas nitroreducens TaxID=447425 RepID=A0A431V4H6_9GAMM|nr:hypothetical protein [Halomonas nitroreducens]RTR05123.1 hypothetical protein EKG36_08380 [Halomonas nitroreducens]
MQHIHLERLPWQHLDHLKADMADVVFLMPHDEEVRGVGVDPRQGIFLLLKSNLRVFPIYDGSHGNELCGLQLLAVEVDDANDQRVSEFVTERLWREMGVAAG